jgi:hypothetical protein
LAAPCYVGPAWFLKTVTSYLAMMAPVWEFTTWRRQQYEAVRASEAREIRPICAVNGLR